MPEPDLEKRHKRYTQQAHWSAALRKHIYNQLPRNKPLSILEVGCGSGAVLHCIADEIPDRVGILTGIDIDPAAARFSSRDRNFRIGIADGERLPFRAESFDLVFCHYLLLWCRDPRAVVREMRRVTAEGGICAALAEPCYIELEASPDSLYRIACFQRQRLAELGADVGIGGEIGDLFRNAGFERFEFGCYQKGEMTEAYLNAEIRQIAEDIRIDPSEVCEGRPHVYHVPTYFAFAVK